MLTRRRLLAAAGVVPLSAAVACGVEGDNVLERARNAGALRVGISGERPYCYVDTDGTVTGAQPEVAKVVLGNIGIAGLQAVQVPFTELIPGLRSGQFQMVTAGMTVTPDRCAEVAFTRPDFVAPPAFVVPEDNPRDMETFDDVARSSVTLAVLDGAIELEYALAAGVPAARLLVVDDPSDILQAVADDDAAAGALTRISLVDELRRNAGSGLEVTDAIRPVVDGRVPVPAAAFAVQTGETELLAAFNEELTALQRSGEWLRITERFGFTEANLPPRDLTTGEVCSPT
jgi:polar amino acid transport system substrate-binding protein